MDTWQIILAIVIVGLSIVMPFIIFGKEKIEQQKELDKIKKYGEAINQLTKK